MHVTLFQLFPLSAPVERDPLKERIVLIFYIHCYGLPWWLSGKESACNTGDAGDMGLILGLGKSPGKPLTQSLAEFSPQMPESFNDSDSQSPVLPASSQQVK